MCLNGGEPAGSPFSFIELIVIGLIILVKGGCRMPRYEAPQHEEFSRRYDIQDISEIRTDVLIAFPWEGRTHPRVRLITEEFTSVCPWSGLPDFGRIVVEYIPRDRLVEMKSFKYYLLSFRNVGILQEEVVDRIFRDLKELLDPMYLRVEGYFNARGGIATEVILEENFVEKGD